MVVLCWQASQRKQKMFMLELRPEFHSFICSRNIYQGLTVYWRSRNKTCGLHHQGICRGEHLKVSLFLISSASVRSLLTISVLYYAHLCMKCSLGISNFLEEISSLFHSIVFFSLCIDHLGRLSYLSLLLSGTLNSDGYIFPFLLCLLLLFFSQIFVRPPQTTILPFCISFSWGWFWSLSPVPCHEPPSIVLQALYQT